MKAKEQRFFVSVSDVGVALLLFVFPLFVHQGYFDITFAKFACFFVLSVSFLFFCFIRVHLRHRIRCEVNRPLYKENAIDKWLLMFFLAQLMSVVVSEYPYNSLVGYAGRYMGFDLTIAIFAAYIFIGKYYILKEREFHFLLVSSALVFGIALLQIFGFDPFGFYQAVSARDQKIFLSTIGNINVVSSFLSMVIPLAAGLFCLQENKKVKQVLLLSLIFLAWFTTLLANSDSGYIGIGVGCWIIGYFAFRKPGSAKRFIGLLLLFCFPILLVRILKHFDLLQKQLSSLTGFVTSRWIYLITAILIVFLILLKFRPLQGRSLRICRRLYLGLSIAAVGVVALAFIYFSCFNREFYLGRLEEFLRFSDSWGTERGSIWKMCLRTFRSFSLKHKLFGYGVDTLGIALSTFEMDSMKAMGYLTNNAHNEYLQYLLTIGIFGLFFYLGFLVSACRKLLRSKTRTWLCQALVASIIAYALQAVVNISQPITTPLFFVLLACARCAEEPGCDN